MTRPKSGKSKKGFANRHPKFFWLSIVILVLLTGYILFNWLFSTCCAPPVRKSPSTESIYTDAGRLADPNLLYSSSSTAGLCAKGNKQGGCYANTYLYIDGRLLKNSGFYNYDSKNREDSQPIQIQINSAVTSQINKKINDSNIMNKDCPNGQIMDAGWDYQINFNGVKKTFHNVYGDCKKVFDDIDQLIKSGGG